MPRNDSDLKFAMNATQVNVFDHMVPTTVLISVFFGASFPSLTDMLKCPLSALSIDAMTAHSAMSKQVLENENVRKILLGPGRLWEMLREEEHGSANR